MVDAYSKYIEMVELNYLDIPLAGSNPVLTTKLMECGLKSSHHLKSCPLVGAYGQKVNIQGSRYWVSHVGNNEPRILV